MRPLKLAATVVIGFANTFNTAYAGSNGYQCEIFQAVQLESDGKLSSPASVQMAGHRFSIDRNSGALIGPEAGFPWVFRDGITRVADRGSAENYFKVFYESPAARDGAHATFIQIKEPTAGKSKPFMAISGNHVYTGHCE